LLFCLNLPVSFTKSLTPFFADKQFKKTTYSSTEKIVVLPLPTLSRFTISMWHTLLFIFGLKRGLKNVQKHLDHYDYFYYLMHPADLENKKHTIERL
jgi:hypothetical protein